MSPRLLLLLSLSVASATFAQDSSAPRAEDLRNLMSARAYGMGGAYRALGLGSEAVVGNPAATGLYRTYRIELTGAWDYRQKDASFGATIMDANTSALAAGLDYRLVSIGRGVERTTAHLGTLAFALPLAQSLYVGTSARYLMMGGRREANATTVDAGVILKLSQSIALGFSGHNLIDTQNAELTRYFSGHLGYTSGLFTAAADVRGDFVTRPENTFTYSGGLEYVLGQGVPVRAGYTYDGFTRGHIVAAGLGLMAEGSGLDLAYQHEIGGDESRQLALTIKLQLH
jgi:hypothetical protein